MNFTIGKDFLIRGTRGETGTIHITFDSDMTGTKGVFLVKKTPETPDDAAYLVKTFTFGSNPSISGREVIISLVQDDTKFIPIEVPDSPYVFESDYRDIKCIDYVWSIKIYGDDCTEMIIPGEGMKYPTFRLYNDAVADRGGRPIVPECHHRKHHDDMFVTKRDLLHYATMDGRRHDEIVSGVEANETDIKQLNRSVLDIYKRINDSTSQSDNKISTLELKVETNASNIAKLQTAVDDVSDILDDFTDKFEEAGDFVHGVRSERTFTSNRWAETPSWMLGATAAQTIRVVGKDCVSVDMAVDKLFEADEVLAEKIADASKSASDQISVLSTSVDGRLTELSTDVDTKVADVTNTVTALSGNAQSMDEVLSESIEQLKVLVGTGTETVQTSVAELSGNAKTADDELAKDIKTLNQGTSTLITTLGQSLTTLSGNAKTTDETLATRIGDLSTLVANSVTDASTSITTLSGYAKTADESIATSLSTLSGNAKTVDATLATDISTLSGNAKACVETIATSVTTLSGNAKTADESLATAISTLSGNAKTTDANLSQAIADLKSLVGSGTDTVQTSVNTLSGNAKTADEALAGLIDTTNSTVSTLSGNAKTADSNLFTSISTLSGNAKTVDEALATQITTVVSDYVKKESISTELTADSDNNHVPGVLAAYNFVNSSINNFAAFYITKNVAGDAFATKAELTSAISTGAFYNGGAKRVPTKNDYLVVLADESRKTDTGLVPTTRYSFDGTQWAFQYVVNNTSLTQAQVDSLNSGVTAKKLSDISDTLTSLGSDATTLSGNAKAVDEALGTSIKTLSGNAKIVDTSLATSIQTLSGNAQTVDAGLATSIETLSGNAKTADEALAGRITTLSGVAAQVANEWYSSYTTLSGNAKSRDDGLDGAIKTLSGNAKTADTSLSTSIQTLSGNAKTTDEALAGRITTLEGTSTEHESRITSLEQGRLFASLEEARLWTKTYVPGLVYAADGSADKSSEYTDKNVLKLVLGIVTKLASSPAYFESQTVANAWVKTFVPNIVLNADGTMTDASVFTDEEVMALVLGIVAKMASNH